MFFFKKGVVKTTSKRTGKTGFQDRFFRFKKGIWNRLVSQNDNNTYDIVIHSGTFKYFQW